MRSHCDTLLFLNEKTTIPFGVALSCSSAAPSSPTGSSPVPRPRAPALSRLEDERVQSSPVLVPIATSVPGTRLRAGRALRSRRSRGPVPPRCAGSRPTSWRGVPGTQTERNWLLAVRFSTQRKAAARAPVPHVPRPSSAPAAPQPRGPAHDLAGVGKVASGPQRGPNPPGPRRGPLRARALGLGLGLGPGRGSAGQRRAARSRKPPRGPSNPSGPTAPPRPIPSPAPRARPL